MQEGLTNIQQQVDELKVQLDSIANEEDVAAINENLDGVNQDLAELLESSNVFSGDITINSDATLEFAEALGDRVMIVNGNVNITLQLAIDNARVQVVASKFKTITGNLNVRAVAATVSPVQFDALIGVGDLTISHWENPDPHLDAYDRTQPRSTFMTYIGRDPN